MSFWGRMFGSSFAEFDQRQPTREAIAKYDLKQKQFQEYLDKKYPRQEPAAPPEQTNLRMQQAMAQDQSRQYQMMQGLGQYSQNQQMGMYANPYDQLTRMNDQQFAQALYSGPSRDLFNNIDALRSQMQPAPWLNQSSAAAPAKAPRPVRTAPEIELNPTREISLKEDE